MTQNRGTLRPLTGSVTWCTAVACPRNGYSPLWSRDHKTLGPALGRETGTFPRWTAPWPCWCWAARESLCLAWQVEHERSRQYQRANPSRWLRFWGGGLFPYFLALLLLGGLLIEEAFDLHVQMRRLVLAAPALLLSAAPRSRSPHQRRVGSRRQRGGVRRRARALNRGGEAWGSFMGCLFFCFSFDSSSLAAGRRPDHGP